MDEIQLTQEKSFQIELSSDKNNYSLEFNLNNYIEITANQINNIIHKSYSNKYSFEEIRETKYFLQFDTFNEILDEIKDRIYNNKIILKEDDNNLILNILLPSSKNKEIIFELKPVIKSSNDRLNELTDLIMKLNMEINNIKNVEIANLNKENKHLNEENEQIKKEINYIKDKELQLINSNEQIINNVNFLKNENNQLKNDINLLKKEVGKLKNDNNQMKDSSIQLKNENMQLKKEVTELNEKLNILWSWRENMRIKNLDSKIIKENEVYNKRLKKWIDPIKKIKAELLYRLSENGDKFSTFHELCDNKGPTLTLFHVNDGNNVGIYTPISWDSTSDWKKDMETFIFNLNKNQKYNKLKSDYFFYCRSSFGPFTSDFGCLTESMKSIKHWGNDINKYYDKGSEILPSNKQEKEYNLIESEVYRIIFE